MNSLEWFEILKIALIQTKTELDCSQIIDMLLIYQEEETNYFSPFDETNNQIYILKLSQAWKILVQILNNELQLNSWNIISICGLKNKTTIFSLGSDSFQLLLSILHNSNFDPIDIIKILLRNIFLTAYKDKYETTGLIASEGYPVWVTFPEGKVMDDFLFAISITSLLSLVERIDMEVSAGGINSCIIQGENLLLSVSFNPTQDYALAVTLQGDRLNDVCLDLHLKKIFEKILDPVIFSVIVPEITDPDRERMLKDIRQEFGGETTEEEIQTLSMFDTDTLQSLQNEIKIVATKYGAHEISIGYLRKRMKLPSEVLSIALEYLISNRVILGRIGKDRNSGREILLLDLSVERSKEEITRVNEIAMQVEDLFLPLNPLLDQIPIIEDASLEIQEEISEALSEFQVILTLSDTEPLFLLKNDLRLARSQLENSIKGLILLKRQLSETHKSDVLYSELKSRSSSLENKNIEYQRTIIGKAMKFNEDLLNSYRFLLRLIPVPSEFRSTDDNDKIKVIFRCPAYKCETTAEIISKPEFWIKIALFSVILKISDEFPNENIHQVKELKEFYEYLYQELIKLVNKTEIGTRFEYLHFLEKIDELLVTNKQRDEAIAKLRQCFSYIDKQKKDYYSLFIQCKSCQHWYCRYNTKHMSKDSKCIYC